MAEGITLGIVLGIFGLVALGEWLHRKQSDILWEGVENLRKKYKKYHITC